MYFPYQLWFFYPNIPHQREQNQGQGKVFEEQLWDNELQNNVNMNIRITLHISILYIVVYGNKRKTRLTVTSMHSTLIGDSALNNILSKLLVTNTRLTYSFKKKRIIVMNNVCFMKSSNKIWYFFIILPWVNNLIFLTPCWYKSKAQRTAVAPPREWLTVIR